MKSVVRRFHACVEVVARGFSVSHAESADLIYGAGRHIMVGGQALFAVLFSGWTQRSFRR